MDPRATRDPSHPAGHGSPSMPTAHLGILAGHLVLVRDAQHPLVMQLDGEKL
jgi:hypothetical protein